MRGWVIVRTMLVACLLSVPMALTVLRLTQPLNSSAVQLVGLAPLALPLYGIALACALMPVVRLRGRTWYVLTASTALVGLACHLVWFAPQATGAVPEPAEDAPTVTVMASNLRKGQGNAAALVRAAVERDVDVLVVEEITPRALAAMEAEGLPERFPYSAGTPARGVVGTMVFSRLRLDDAERLATGFGSWRVRVGDDLAFIAVHTTAPTNPERWRTDFDEVLSTVRAQPPQVLLGDFNATADHEPMRDLLHEGFRDAAELINTWQPTWPANNQGPGVIGFLPPLARIDQVLVGPDMAALSSDTVRIENTDHLAVVAEVARAATRS